jgi:putative sterol carrier protein
MIHENFDKINNMENAKEMTDATSAVFALIDPPSDTGETTNGDAGTNEAMNPETIFKKMPDGFKADAAAGVDVVFQFNVKGPEGGDWIVAVKDGKCDIKPGNAKNPNCTLKISDDNFVKLFTGTMTPMQAFSSGKLSLDGDIMKSQLIEKIFDLKRQF